MKVKHNNITRTVRYLELEPLLGDTNYVRPEEVEFLPEEEPVSRDNQHTEPLQPIEHMDGDFDTTIKLNEIIDRLNQLI